jgi:hypothetical protein
MCTKNTKESEKVKFLRELPKEWNYEVTSPRKDGHTATVIMQAVLNTRAGSPSPAMKQTATISLDES